MGKRSREKRREREVEQARNAAADPAPTGHITWSSRSGATERMAYWLPPGVTPEDIGLPNEETST